MKHLQELLRSWRYLLVNSQVLLRYLLVPGTCFAACHDGMAVQVCTQRRSYWHLAVSCMCITLLLAFFPTFFQNELHDFRMYLFTSVVFLESLLSWPHLNLPHVYLFYSYYSILVFLTFMGSLDFVVMPSVSFREKTSTSLYFTNLCNYCILAVYTNLHLVVRWSFSLYLIPN